MKKLFQYSLKSSTLVEVIVAMLVTSLIFALSFSVIINVFRANSLSNNAYYHVMTHKYMDELLLESSKGFQNREFTQFNMVFKQEIIERKGVLNVYQLNVSCFDIHGKEKAVYKRLFFDES